MCGRCADRAVHSTYGSGWGKGGGGKITRDFPLSSEAAVAKGKANDKQLKNMTLPWVFPG